MKTPKNLTSLIKKAEKLLQGYHSFSISTKIPKEWMVQEEADFDMKLKNADSIKNLLNQKISHKLVEKTKCRYERDGEIRVVFDFTQEKPTVSSEPIPVFVFGRYKKLAIGLSQSRWICLDCNGKGCAKCNEKGKHYESVEERIGDVMKKHFEAADYSLHASGREDIDATNTAGRPFVMEIKDPNKISVDLEKIRQEIGKPGEVSVHDLKIVPRSFVELVTESHFDKQYKAEIEFEKDIGEQELEKIEQLNGMIISQRTPNRVAHRRSDLVRKRKIIELKIAPETGNRKHATALIRAEAGTYIKELISGDEGRTKPSFAQLLGMNAKCTKLEVTEIDDGFINSCL